MKNFTFSKNFIAEYLLIIICLLVCISFGFIGRDWYGALKAPAVFVDSHMVSGNLLFTASKDALLKTNDSIYSIPNEALNVHAKLGDKLSIIVDAENNVFTNQGYSLDGELFQNNKRVYVDNFKLGTINDYNKYIENFNFCEDRFQSSISIIMISAMCAIVIIVAIISKKYR